MRHSSHSRFVNSPNIDDENSSPPLLYHTTAPRSFQHSYPATLATHRSYADPAFSHQTYEFYYAQLFSQQQRPEHSLDVSHLSNRYTEIVRRQQEAKHQDSAPRSQLQHAHCNASTSSGIPTSRPEPLGLGITFDPPLTVGLAEDETTSSRSISSPGSVSAPLSLHASEVQYLDDDGTCPSVSNDPCHNTESTSMAFHEYPYTAQDVQALMPLNEYAYSSSPSSDFVAHSPCVDLDGYALLPADAEMEDLKSIADLPVDIDENDTLVLEDIVMDSPGSAAIKDKDISMSSPPEREGGQDPMIGLFPDVNLRALVTQFREPSVGINPACIMGSSAILVDSPNGDNDSIRDFAAKDDDDFEMGSDESTVVLQKAPTMTSKSRSPSPTCVTANATLEKETIIDVDEFPDEAVSAIFQVLAASIKKEADAPQIPAIPPPVIAQSRYETIDPSQLQIALPVSTPASSISTAASAPVVPGATSSQDTAFRITGSLSQVVPPPGLPSRSLGRNCPVVVFNGKGEKKKGHHKAKDYRVPLADITQQFRNRTTVFHADPQPTSPTLPAHTHTRLPTQTQPTVEKSPVLNAHLGIPLEELRRKAHEFRERNPGLDIDKGWLQDFAGRLSERGELLDDYRCYVVGCSQRNKRRDHILVHVGSHVEYRPFECEHW